MTRDALPPRRESDVYRFDHGKTRFFGSVSRYPDGRPAEVFLDAGKIGSEVQHVARDGAVVLSLALQHGAPIETIRDAMTRLDDGSPAGPLGRFVDMVALSTGGERS